MGLITPQPELVQHFHSTRGLSTPSGIVVELELGSLSCMVQNGSGLQLSSRLKLLTRTLSNDFHGCIGFSPGRASTGRLGWVFLYQASCGRGQHNLRADMGISCPILSFDRTKISVPTRSNSKTRWVWYNTDNKVRQQKYNKPQKSRPGFPLPTYCALVLTIRQNRIGVPIRQSRPGRNEP